VNKRCADGASRTEVTNRADATKITHVVYTVFHKKDNCFDFKIIFCQIMDNAGSCYLQ